MAAGDRFYAHMDEAPDGAQSALLRPRGPGLLPGLRRCGCTSIRLTGRCSRTTASTDSGSPNRSSLATGSRCVSPCEEKALRSGAGYGEVRWDTAITNQHDELVARYDVLTMLSEQVIPDASNWRQEIPERPFQNDRSSTHSRHT